MTVTAEPLAGPATTWAGVHVHLAWSLPAVDDFLVRAVAPAAAELRAAGLLADWFFIRYAEGGPHLRVRARPAAGADPAELERGLVDRLTAAVAAADHPVPTAPAGAAPHGTVRVEPYRPETERYGGPAAVAVAEDVFARSTELALALLARRPTAEQRLAVALELTVATAEALGLDPLTAIRWLRTSAYAWRWHRGPGMADPARLQGPALAAAAVQAPSVHRRWAAVAGQVRAGTGYCGRWAAHVRRARAATEVPGAPGETRWLGVWASQLHMLCNRLGVLPDEERSLAWFLAACLAAPDGPADYFADGTAAADRRYLDASRYQLPLMDDQQPRSKAAAPERLIERPPFAADPVPLPAEELPAVPLATALAGRATARGGLAGPVTAADLGTLLWPAYAPGGPEVRYGPGGTEVWRRRPYPSAGACYPARLRLLARDVEGLAPGVYDLDPERRTACRLAAAPSVAELTAASMWFVDRPSPDRIDVTTLPALLALHLDLGPLRARYGLRALRFGLLEAGHLAQNLALTAAATGLAAATVGGFYDDAAAELLLLDGVDDVLVYLLPVGRPVIA